MLPESRLPDNFQIIDTEAALKLKDYSFDYESKRFNSGLSTGINALKEWVQKALDTPRGRYIIYSANYGLALDELVAEHLPPDMFEMELKRIVRECLLYHPLIKDVIDFKFEHIGDQGYASFTVVSSWANFEQGVLY